MKAAALSFALLLLLISISLPAYANPIIFSTGLVTNSIAMASRPESAGKIEIEAADDFILTGPSSITGGTFTGLITGATAANVGQVVLEIYRVFPADSNVGRTSGPPTFSTSNVPTRVNSPSDVEFAGRESTLGQLSFSTTILSSSFTALNSVLNGINPVPGNLTGGEGPVTGQEVQFNFTLNSPISLPPDHYFFVPQVEITTPTGEFYWLSGSRPIVPPGTPFSPDLQAWIRNADLDPDWLRVGTDIVGGGNTFNAAFSLTAVPEPSTWTLVLFGIVGIGISRLKNRA